jgi:hypothetical protein
MLLNDGWLLIFDMAEFASVLVACRQLGLGVDFIRSVPALLLVLFDTLLEDEQRLGMGE